MELTGLKDMNGREICVNDIVATPMGPKGKPKINMQSLIRMKDGKLYMVFRRWNGGETEIRFNQDRASHTVYVEHFENS